MEHTPKQATNGPPPLPEAATRSLEGSTLFYPCSRDDVVEPVLLLAPRVREFLFVDLGYFGPARTSRLHRRPMDRVSTALAGLPRFELLDRHLEGPAAAELEKRTDPATGRTYPWIDTGVLSETYRDRKHNATFVVRRRRGYGAHALEHAVDAPGVFFYRSDSPDGGVGNWLTRRYFTPVLDKLKDGGLVVTDGCGWVDRPFRPLRAFFCKDGVGPEALEQLEPFEAIGRRFEPVG